jgi:predicted CoA-binding protein
VQQFSLPRMAVLKAKVDQPNNVAAVVSSPSPAEIASYLRRTLPAAGFTITADNPAAKTLTFIGNGWTGSFTGDNNGVSAVLLRPQ